MRTKDDPQIFDPMCQCGKSFDRICWHRDCNLVFCSACIGTHACRPVNGPISPEKSRPEPPVLLPGAPGAQDEGNGQQSKHISGNGHKGPKLKRKRGR